MRPPGPGEDSLGLALGRRQRRARSGPTSSARAACRAGPVDRRLRGLVEPARFLFGVQELLELLPADELVGVGVTVGDLDVLRLQPALALLGTPALVITPDVLDEPAGPQDAVRVGERRVVRSDLADRDRHAH